MSNYPDMREMARLATENYARIESLEQIRPPYPARGTPNWWSLRLRYEQLLHTRLRRERDGQPLPGDGEQQATRAKWTALGNELATLEYQRDGRTRDWWIANWNRAASLSGRAETSAAVEAPAWTG